MAKMGRIWLRNRIIECLNVWYHKELGCHVIPGKANFKRSNEGQWKFFERLISGTASDGRAIWLYPANTKRSHHPVNVMAFMLAQEKLGAIVGIAYDTSDAFDIVRDRPLEYPRKGRTYGFRSKHGNRSTSAEETETLPAEGSGSNVQDGAP